MKILDKDGAQALIDLIKSKLKDVQSDWSTTDTTAASFIKNKPGVVSKTANGLAPKLPNETTTTKYLRQDGTWVAPPNTNTTYTYSMATDDANGYKLTLKPSSGTATTVTVPSGTITDTQWASIEGLFAWE